MTFHEARRKITLTKIITLALVLLIDVHVLL